MSNSQNGQQSNPASRMDEKEREAWARKIRPARVEKGITQDDLEMMSGVSRRTIGNIEAGRMIPQASKLWKLMVALDLGPDPADSYPDWVKTWLAFLGPMIAKLPEATRERVLLNIATTIGEAIREDKTISLVTGMTREQTDAQLRKAQELGLIPDSGEDEPTTAG